MYSHIEIYERDKIWEEDLERIMDTEDIESKKYFEIYCDKEIKDSKILDYGCGWGRIIRFFLKDVPSRNLFAVDPDKNARRQSRVFF